MESFRDEGICNIFVKFIVHTRIFSLFPVVYIGKNAETLGDATTGRRPKNQQTISYQGAEPALSRNTTDSACLRYR